MKTEIHTKKQIRFLWGKGNNRFLQTFYKMLKGDKISTEEKKFVKYRAKRYFEVFND